MASALASYEAIDLSSGHSRFRTPLDADRLEWLGAVRAHVDYHHVRAVTMVPPWVNRVIRVSYVMRDRDGRPLVGGAADSAATLLARPAGWIPSVRRFGNIVFPILRDRADIRDAMETAYHRSLDGAATFLAFALEKELRW